MRQQSPMPIDFAPSESDPLHGSMPFFILSMTRDICLQILIFAFFRLQCPRILWD